MEVSKNGTLKFLIITCPLVILAIRWCLPFPLADQLVRQVNNLTVVPWLETPYLYTYLHLFTFIPVFCLSFDKKVAFYKRWPALLPALLIVSVVFIIWDVLFTHWDVWGFNDQYYMGITIGGLPWEECLFFVVMPFGSIFIYECLNAYFPNDPFRDFADHLSVGLIILFLLVAVISWSQVYTFTAFLSAGALLLYHFLFLDRARLSRFLLAYLIGLLPFILVNGVLTGALTSQPVVMYNPKAYLGARFGTIPFDDFAYCFVLLHSVLVVYEYIRSKKA